MKSSEITILKMSEKQAGRKLRDTLSGFQTFLRKRLFIFSSSNEIFNIKQIKDYLQVEQDGKCGRETQTMMA